MHGTQRWGFDGGVDLRLERAAGRETRGVIDVDRRASLSHPAASHV
jgi:hypothetical protein